MKIAVYCGSDFGNNEEYAKAARELGQWIGKISRQGCRFIRRETIRIILWEMLWHGIINKNSRLLCFGALTG